jgi:hypothetical protein
MEPLKVRVVIAADARRAINQREDENGMPTGKDHQLGQKNPAGAKKAAKSGIDLTAALIRVRPQGKRSGP